MLQLGVGQAAWVLGFECPASLGDRWRAVKDWSLAWVHRRAGFRMEQASSSGPSQGTWSRASDQPHLDLGKPIETSTGR